MKDKGGGWWGEKGRGVQAPFHRVPYLESCSQYVSRDVLTVSG